MALKQDKTVGWLLVAGLCGGAAALIGWLAAVAVYFVGYGIETGFTYEAQGDDSEFTGFASLLFAVPIGSLTLPFAGWLLLRRFGFSSIARIQFLAAPAVLLVSWTVSTNSGFLLPGLIGVFLLAVLTCVFGGLCYAATVIVVDRRGRFLWNLMAFFLLLAIAISVFG